jgi:ribosomal protein S14
MKYLLFKNKKLYNTFFNNEIQILKLKFISKNLKIPAFIRQQAAMGSYRKYNLKARNRCVISNKSRSIFNYFKISRIKLRQLFSNSFVNGVKKKNY